MNQRRRMTPGTNSYPPAWPQGGGGQADAAVPETGQSTSSVTQVRGGLVISLVVMVAVVIL